jgi:DNA-binding XRE family transcriptional regulator
MKQYSQKDIENLINQYNRTDKQIIKKNTVRILSESGYQYTDIANRTGIGVQTLYQYNKEYVTNYPNFLTALKIANFLEIDITEFILNSKENLMIRG